MASRGKVISLREKELVFDFVGASHGKVFDDPATHGRPCMKAVDFVVEYDDFDLFVEVKDPDMTGLTEEDRRAFVRKLKSGDLVRALAGKYRDSWIYRWAERRDKPVHYAVLLQLPNVRPPELLTLTGRLKRELPLEGPPSWTRPFVQSALVLDIAAWNAHGRYGTVRRVPRGPKTPL